MFEAHKKRKRRERKGREGKGREGKGREGKDSFRRPLHGFAPLSVSFLHVTVAVIEELSPAVYASQMVFSL